MAEREKQVQSEFKVTRQRVMNGMLAAIAEARAAADPMAQIRGWCEVAKMLGYYAQRFSAVELNNTFYRMPKADVVASWAEQVPDGFQFALKARQVITHMKRLKETEKEAADFLRIASGLKEHLGPVLFQLPPNFKKDLPRLDAFLGSLQSMSLGNGSGGRSYVIAASAEYLRYSRNSISLRVSTPSALISVVDF